MPRFRAQSEGGRTGTIEEHYTAPSENLMLGTTRYIVESQTVMFEFTKLEVEGGEIVLTPYPRGRPSEHAFRRTGGDAGQVVFEAPEHDFPKRITYRRHGESLIARIDDGSDEKVSEWEMKSAPCN